MKTYAIYRKSFKSINIIIETPIESLNQIKASRKNFANKTGVSGFYKTLVQQILQYDYENKEYKAWLANMRKYNSYKLAYLNEDKYVLNYEVAQGETVTVGDVLETFTPEGEKNTKTTFDQLTGIVSPPAPGPSPSPTPNSKKALNKIDHEIRVSPISLFKNYELVKHVSKAIIDKTVKADAAALREKTLAEAKVELKAKEDAILRNDTSEEIARLDMEIDKTVHTDVHNVLIKVDNKMETELDETVNDIKLDLGILEDV
jgi:hypothetical protein